MQCTMNTYKNSIYTNIIMAGTEHKHDWNTSSRNFNRTMYWFGVPSLMILMCSKPGLAHKHQATVIIKVITFTDHGPGRRSLETIQK